VFLREKGCIVSINNDIAVVGIGMSGACKKCGLCMASSDGKEMLILAKNDIGAHEGDSVEIEILPGKVVAAAFVVYMIPVVMTVIGFLVGNALTGGSETSLLPIILAVVFLVGSFFGVWVYDMRVRRHERQQARITRLLTGEEERSRVEVIKFGG
jgi:sigma-E factor negative regulatory protein RseC